MPPRLHCWPRWRILISRRRWSWCRSSRVLVRAGTNVFRQRAAAREPRTFTRTLRRAFPRRPGRRELGRRTLADAAGAGGVEPHHRVQQAASAPLPAPWTLAGGELLAHAEDGRRGCDGRRAGVAGRRRDGPSPPLPSPGARPTPAPPLDALIERLRRFSFPGRGSHPQRGRPRRAWPVHTDPGAVGGPRRAACGLSELGAATPATGPSPSRRPRHRRDRG